MAQFMTEIHMFDQLAGEIGRAGAPGSAPVLPPRNETTGAVATVYRNVTGICDDRAKIARFSEIAAKIKANAQLEGILFDMEIQPYGVVCLAYPLNNTVDFPKGVYFDESRNIGIDTINDPLDKPSVMQNLMSPSKVILQGPYAITVCPDCAYVVGQTFIARLNVQSNNHTIDVDGQVYNSWGFVAALINWQALIDRSGIYESFHQLGFGFLLTRTDQVTDQKTGIQTDNVSQENLLLIFPNTSKILKLAHVDGRGRLLF